MIKEFRFVEEHPILRDEIDAYGREVVDPTPVAIPIRDIVPPSSMMELIHQLYRSMADSEKETFEDADDLEIDDDDGIEMMRTPYEVHFDHVGESAAPAEMPAEPAPDPAPSE